MRPQARPPGTARRCRYRTEVHSEHRARVQAEQSDVVEAVPAPQVNHVRCAAEDRTQHPSFELEQGRLFPCLPQEIVMLADMLHGRHFPRSAVTFDVCIHSAIVSLHMDEAVNVRVSVRSRIAK